MSPQARTLILLIAAFPTMWAQNLYNVTTIIQNGSPGHSWASGINNSGQIVGGSTDGIHSCLVSPFWSGFLYSDGVTSRVGGPATAINDGGQIAGYYASNPGGARRVG